MVQYLHCFFLVLGDSLEINRQAASQLPFLEGHVIKHLTCIIESTTPPKMDGWKTILTFWVTGNFSGAIYVKLRVCNLLASIFLYLHIHAISGTYSARTHHLR